MSDYYPEQHPYGSSTAGTKYKDLRYNRHADWIEPLVSNLTSTLSRGHIQICANCGAKVSLTANIIRRHLATEKHLRSIDKWTEQDEAEMLEYKKTCMPKSARRSLSEEKGNKPKNGITFMASDKNDGDRVVS